MTVENPAATAPAEAAAPAQTAPTTPSTTDTAPAATSQADTTSVKTETAPVVETKSESAPAEEKTLLGASENKTAPANTNSQTEAAKTAPNTEQTKEPGKQSDEPAPLPTYQAWKLSEGVKLDDARMGEFNKELADFQVRTKADQAAMQEFGQKLIDRHVADVNAAVQNTIKELNEHYKKSWNEQRDAWKQQTLKDSELGGNRQETTIKSANEFIKTHGGTAEQQKEFRDLLETTGLGNHPAMIRLLSNAARNMKEGKPLPASKPESTVKSAMAKRYGN